MNLKINGEEMKIKIDINKKYKTHNGDEVIIHKTDCGREYPVHASVRFRNNDYWNVMIYTVDGISSGGNVKYNLVEIKPYDHIKVDDKVLVWDDDNPIQKFKRYFAGVSDSNKPMTWKHGSTSWSIDKDLDTTNSWDECELVED